MITVAFDRFFMMALVSVFLAVSPPAAGEEAPPEKALGLENVMITCYALGGDVSSKRAYEEGIYLAKGDRNKALEALKGIIIEGKRPVLSFKMKDQIEAIIFRGTFSTLYKVGIKKVVLRDSEIEVHAEYTEFPDCSTVSQPAAIIPVGKLPPGKYSVTLFVDNKLRKRIEFSVSR